MKPKACVNCGVNYWQMDDLLMHCSKCREKAVKLGKIIDAKRKKRQADEKLDLDEIVQQREWL